MAAQLSFSMLGALEVRIGDQRVVIGSPRQRAVLSMLLLSADQVVSIDSMLDAVWNGRPPATGRTQIAICVAALRKAFRTAGHAEEVIITNAPGYLLRSAGHQIDAVDFVRLATAAHDAARHGRTAEAVDLFDAALDLWHGPALAGVAGYPVEVEAARLEEQRLFAYEARTALRLELGQHAALISELAVVVAEHPLREQVRAQLMLAQYRAGRRAEALQTFRTGRRCSIEEVGVEPGPTLHNLHDAILRDDPSLTLSPMLGVRLGGGLPPAQLPLDPPGFIGREAELSTLNDLLSGRDADHAPAVGVVVGAAGVGKTDLALHWAHRAAARFPDGQLFADLHGYDERAEPAQSVEILGSFLRALGVPNDDIPVDLSERETLYRSILDGRRVLVILDNARTVHQVLPLLPSNGRCCVLITGRGGLGHLLGGHGVTRVRLGMMAEPEVRAMLRVLVGDGRITSDPEGAAQLGELCGQLPLALRISAAKLAARPHWTVRHLVNRLVDHRQRLAELDADVNGVGARLETSYRHLSPDAARVYRRLGMLDSPRFAAWVGAAVLDTTLNDAERLLEQLVDAQLLDVGFDGSTIRYGFHDLVRLHAREHALCDENLAQRRAAGERVLGGWLSLAAEAHLRGFGAPPPVDHAAIPWHFCPERDREYVDVLLTEPRTWLRRERPSILAAMDRVTVLHPLPPALNATARTLLAGQDHGGQLLGSHAR